jgi:hypothetical protein
MGDPPQLPSPYPPRTLAVPVFVKPGMVRTIYAYRATDGSAPAIDFLNGLNELEQGRYFLKFEIMCQDGRLRGQNYHTLKKSKGNKHVEDLAEFKDIGSKSRMPCFPDPEARGVIILTHGFGGKKENETDPVQVARAVSIRSDYIARRDEMLRRFRSEHPGNLQKHRG